MQADTCFSWLVPGQYPIPILDRYPPSSLHVHIQVLRDSFSLHAFKPAGYGHHGFFDISQLSICERPRLLQQTLQEGAVQLLPARGSAGWSQLPAGAAQLPQCQGECVTCALVISQIAQPLSELHTWPL